MSWRIPQTTGTSASGPEVVLISGRPAVQTFFSQLAHRTPSPFSLRLIPPAQSAHMHHAERVATANVAIVDVAPDPAVAIRLCQEQHRQRPNLPILGLLCCGTSITPFEMTELVAAGVHSLLDLHATGEEAIRAIYDLARGATVLHVRLSRDHSAPLGDLMAGRGRKRTATDDALPASDQVLLELLSRGLSDRLIGQRVHLSPHTVKHHVERLRHGVGARNRTELAAWAGRQGLYRPEPLANVA